MLAKQCGVLPSEVFMVGDTKADMAAGKNANIGLTINF